MVPFDDIPSVGLTSCVILVYAGVSFGNASDNVMVLEPDADGVQRATIVLDSYAFTPDHLKIQAGVPVELWLDNQSFLTPHNFVIDAPALESPVNVNVIPGENVAVRLLLSAPGTYPFYCDKQLLFFPSHREEGMDGRLDVLAEGQ